MSKEVKINNVKKWDYKVISIEELFGGEENHDIAVSKEAATMRRSRVVEGLEGNLKKLGSDGWELVALISEFGVFKKPVE